MSDTAPVPASDRRDHAFRALQIAVVGATALFFLLELPSIPAGKGLEITFFIGLTALAFRLRVRYAGNFLGLEAAALVPVILLLDSPGATLLICLTADVLAKWIGRTRRLTLSTAFDLAQLGLSYGVAAVFFQALQHPSPGPLGTGLAAAAALLAFFFVNTILVFAYLELGRLVPP